MRLSTHVLDTMHGVPAAGMRGALYRTADGGSTLLKRFTLDHDGRAPGGPLLADADFQPGVYRLVFEVAAYFSAKGVDLPQPPFLDSVSLDFGVADASRPWHVPLLVTPWSYSTYRGS
jgi:5-hydroxyisourate hydrolase